jgi:DNA-binding LacI/PurR family transcriptional regulator
VLAGLSHQTVSRYLKDKSALKPSTLERVDVVAMDGRADARGQQLNTLLAAEDIAGILSFAPQPGSATAGQSGAAALEVAGEYDNQMRSLGSIADGSRAAGIVQYLASLGHRNIFHVAGPAGWPSARNRRRVARCRPA